MNDSGQPIHAMLADEFGPIFVFPYVPWRVFFAVPMVLKISAVQVGSFMLVSLGIFNVILAVSWLEETVPELRFVDMSKKHRVSRKVRDQ